MQVITDLRNALIVHLVNPLLLLLFTAGLMVFVWGVIEFLLALQGIGGKGSQEKLKNGRKHMLYGIVGMFLMAAAGAIIRIIGTAVGADPAYLPR